MSTLPTPLSYDPLKAILQYMEPNLRLQLARCIPSIRSTEKLVPLKLDTLEFGNLKTTVNNTSYQLEIYRQYPEGCPLDYEDRTRSGIEFDTNEFGFEVKSARNTLLPGDVDLSWQRDEISGNDYSYEYEKILERALQYKTDPSKYSDGILIASPDNRPVDRVLNRQRREWFENILERHGNDLESYRAELVPYYRRRHSVLLPYTQFIQLTIISGIQTSVERVYYKDKKLYEALKYLNTSFFGGRQNPRSGAWLLNVRQLSLTDTDYIFRFPMDFKIRIKEMKCQMVDFTRLDHIIAPSFPLATVHIHGGFGAPVDYQQVAIRTARKLVLTACCRVDIPRNLENPYVVLSQMDHGVAHLRLIDFWLRNGKPVNSLFSFGVQKLETVEDFMADVREKFESKVIRYEGR